MRADPSSRAFGWIINPVCASRMGTFPLDEDREDVVPVQGRNLRHSWKGSTDGLFMGHLRRDHDRERDSFSRRCAV